MTKQTKAFTLIELLVVISIISLLIAILLPALASARASARTIVCASNQRAVGLAIAFYTQDNSQYYPTAVIFPAQLTWQQHVGSRYLSIDSQPSPWAIGIRPPSVFACPSSEQLITGGNRGDYGINWNLSGADNISEWGSLRETDIISAGEIILTADSSGRTLEWAWIHSTLRLEGRHKQAKAGNDPDNVVNVLYADSHVAASAIKELITGPAATVYEQRPWKP